MVERYCGLLKCQIALCNCERLSFCNHRYDVYFCYVHIVMESLYWLRRENYQNITNFSTYIHDASESSFQLNRLPFSPYWIIKKKEHGAKLDMYSPSQRQAICMFCFFSQSRVTCLVNISWHRIWISRLNEWFVIKSTFFFQNMGTIFLLIWNSNYVFKYKLLSLF